MNAVDGVAGDVDGAVEAKGHICSVDIIINGLGQMDDIQSLFPEEIGRLLRTITTQDNQAIQP